jgi:ribosomal protein L7/L12
MHSSVKILCPFCYSPELLMYPEGLNASSAGIIQMPAGNVTDNNMELKCSSCAHVFKAGEGKLSGETDAEKQAYDPMDPGLKALNPDELFVYDLSRRQDKFTAIKYCVTTYGWGLEEAKNYVDNIESRVAGNTVKTFAGADKYENEVIAFIQNQGKLHAIKFVRDHTGLGLKESKDYVDRLVKEHNLSSKKEGCFIATACYGNYDAPEVLTLRMYRDDVLAQTLSGRAFIHLYYTCSPPIARLLSRSEKGKAMVRKYFVAPVVQRIGRGR